MSAFALTYHGHGKTTPLAGKLCRVPERGSRSPQCGRRGNVALGKRHVPSAVDRRSHRQEVAFICRRRVQVFVGAGTVRWPGPIREVTIDSAKGVFQKDDWEMSTRAIRHPARHTGFAAPHQEPPYRVALIYRHRVRYSADSVGKGSR